MGKSPEACRNMCLFHGEIMLAHLTLKLLQALFRGLYGMPGTKQLAARKAELSAILSFFGNRETHMLDVSSVRCQFMA